MKSLSTSKAESQKPLLAECLRAGDAMSLFPILKDWPRAKLNELLGEIEQADKFTDETWAALAMKAENFLSKVRSRELDKARMEIMFVMSEICSVALYYIGKFEERERRNDAQTTKF